MEWAISKCPTRFTLKPWSMAKAPAFQLYAGDFLTDVMDWTDEQVGAHIRLLCWSWVNRRGIPRDTQRLTRIAPKAVESWPVIGAKWVEGPDDTWVNERLEMTRADSDAFRDSQRKRSLLGVAARAKKSAPKGTSNGKPMDQPMGQPMDNPLEGEDEDDRILSSSHQGVSSEHDGSIAEVLPTEVVESPKREREHSSEPHQAELWPRFDDFWALYDKKIDRAKCESKWGKMTQQEREKAMSHAEAYVRFGQGSDPQYRRHPLTYLNNKNFNDEQLTQPRTPRRPSEQSAAEKLAGAREVFQSGLLRGGLFGGDA